jgi:hypothetical protein
VADDFILRCGSEEGVGKMYPVGHNSVLRELSKGVHGCCNFSHSLFTPKLSHDLHISSYHLLSVGCAQLFPYKDNIEFHGHIILLQM